jgi:hypothetical protein
VRRVINGYSYKTQSGKREGVAGTGGCSALRAAEPNTFSTLRRAASGIQRARTRRAVGSANTTARATTALLGEPEGQKADWAIDAEFLKTTACKDPNSRLVVYAEKIWLHPSALREWEAANGKTVRTMIVPFNLR